MDIEILIVWVTIILILCGVVFLIYVMIRGRVNDPVYNCPVYRNSGCSHVDGILCDYPKCSILKKEKYDR